MTAPHPDESQGRLVTFHAGFQARFTVGFIPAGELLRCHLQKARTCLFSPSRGQVHVRRRVLGGRLNTTFKVMVYSPPPGRGPPLRRARVTAAAPPCSFKEQLQRRPPRVCDERERERKMYLAQLQVIHQRLIWRTCRKSDNSKSRAAQILRCFS